MKISITLLLLLFSLQAEAVNTFTIYAFKSSVGVDWSSPKALARSILKNELLSMVNGNDRLLGHVSIKLHCGKRELVTAMSSRAGTTRDMVLNQHSGLGVLFHIFPGLLETKEELEPEIAQKRKNRRIHSVTYLINDEACDLMFDHYEQYLNNQGPHNYGFPLDTLAGEGAGCSAFGVSFLQAAKIAPKAHLEAWRGEVWVPREFIGPHNQDRYESSDQAVYANQLGGSDVKFIPMILSREETAWANEQTPDAQYLSFYDPDTMYNWIEAMVQKWQPSSDYHFRKFQKSYDLVFDLRDQ